MLATYLKYLCNKKIKGDLMKIAIETKLETLKIECDSFKIDNGFIILTNPNWKGKKTLEFWIPISTIENINIYEKEIEIAVH